MSRAHIKHVVLKADGMISVMNDESAGSAVEDSEIASILPSDMARRE